MQVTPRVLTTLSIHNFHFETHKTFFFPAQTLNPRSLWDLTLTCYQYINNMGPLITEHILILFPNISCSCETQTLTRTTLSTSQYTETQPTLGFVFTFETFEPNCQLKVGVVIDDTTHI